LQLSFFVGDPWLGHPGTVDSRPACKTSSSKCD
jgi:hypothetical protein